MRFPAAIGAYRKPSSSVVVAVTVLPTPTPTPTPTTTPNPPVITQTSAAGAAPFAWQTKDDTSFYPGFFWHVQRATSAGNLANGVLNGEAIQQITPQDLASGVVTFADLGSTPVGTLALRERVGHEDGNGGYVWGPWSNVLTDTIAATFNATFDPTKTSDKMTLSASKLVVTGSDLGYNFDESAKVGTALSVAVGYCEFRNSGGSGNRQAPRYGLATAAFDPSGAANVSVPNTCDIFGTVRVDGSFVTNQAGNAYVETIGFLVHKATGKFWTRTAQGWFPEKPTFNPDGSIATGTGYAPATIALYPAANLNDAHEATFNGGASAFVFTDQPANTTKGWA